MKIYFVKPKVETSRRLFNTQSNVLPTKFFKKDLNETHLQTIQNGKIEMVAIPHFLNLCEQYSSIHVDLGTGDGKYIYREAKKNQQKFFIGIDSNPAAPARMSWRACRKPARGGIKNLAFIVSAVENLPFSLKTLADTITINYPWGSLLKDIVIPNQDTLSRIHLIGKPNSLLDIRLNYSIFSDLTYLAKLELPQVNENYIDQCLIPKYLNSAIKIQKYIIGKNLTNTGTWGQHLTLASGRDTLYLHSIIKKKD